MRFRPWPKPEPYCDTSRKRAAFKRKQRLEREALPLFADMIAAGQHGVDEEMARRTSGGTNANESSAPCAPHVGAKPVRDCLRCTTTSAAQSENSGGVAPIPPIPPICSTCCTRSLADGSTPSTRPGSLTAN